MRCVLFAAWVTFGFCGVVAAPVPKEKEQEPPPATDQQRERAQANLREIMHSMHTHESARQFLPGDIVDAKTKKGLLSWRVQILLYLDNKESQLLYEKFALDEPWDSNTNKPLIAKMPKIFAPVRVKAEVGHTFYRGFRGNGAFFEPGEKRTFVGITDGTSNTIAVIEAGESVIWTKPDSDIPFDPKKPLPPLGKDIDGVFHVAWIDGSCIRLKRDFDAEAMKAAITIAGGEVFETELLFPEKK